MIPYRPGTVVRFKEGILAGYLGSVIGETRGSGDGMTVLLTINRHPARVYDLHYYDVEPVSADQGAPSDPQDE